MPKIAVLGGSGFVGRNVCERLRAADMDVAPLSRSSGFDLTDFDSASRTLQDVRPDVIVNCAAVVGSLKYVTDFAADVVDANMRIILNVFRLARLIPNAVVINPIANCAYPGVMETYREDRFWDGPLHPTVLSYGSTRRMMWVLSLCYHQQYRVPSVNMLVPNMYGPYDSTEPSKTHALNALAAKFVRAAKEELAEVEVWGTGVAVREWLFVKDYAAAVQQVIESGQRDPQPVNIAQNRGYTVRELADMLCRVTGFAGRVTYNPAFPDGAPKKVMDDALFRRRFPDFTFTPLEEGLRETVQYYAGVL